MKKLMIASALMIVLFFLMLQAFSRGRSINTKETPKARVVKTNGCKKPAPAIILPGFLVS